MSQALRKLAGTLNRTDTICLFTNQLREKIGVMFGSPETTPGGRALKFYSSVRLDIRRIETLKDGAEAYGNRVRVKVVKNKVAPPFKQAEFDIIYGSGISWESSVLDVGIERKIVAKSGSYFSFGDERLGQGRQNAASFLKEHPDVVQQILAGIQAQAGPSRRSRRGCCRRSRRRGGHPGRGRGRGGGSRLRGVARCPSGRTPSSRRSGRFAFATARTAELDARLARRGVGAAEQGAGARDARAVGYVDDERFARTRAEQLADRGSGDALIRHDLEGRGSPRSSSRRRSRRSSRSGSVRRGSSRGAATASRRPATWRRAASARTCWRRSLQRRTETR